MPAVAALAHPGLSSAEAAERAARVPEREPESATRSVRQIVRENVFTLVNGITLVFLVLIAAARAWADALFAAVIAVNTVIGITQELLAKRKLDRLALLVAPRARVRRDGATTELAPELLVVDDVVELQPGDQVVADGVVLESAGLAMDESVLTGESNQVPKDPGDQVLSGAYCAAGAGLYRVAAVGDDAFAARLTREARAERRELSTMQLEINRLLRILVLLMVPLAVVLIGALWWHQTAFRPAAQTATAGLISLVPEGLVLLASVTFVAGAARIARSGALVQRLNAVESLASVDTVCLDKTGTLTDGSLELVDVIPAPGVDPVRARTALARCAAAGSVRSATSDAIAAALGDVGAERPSAEIAFASRWKWSGVTLGDGTLVLGAPEVLGAGPLAADVATHQSQRARVLVFGAADALPPPPDAGESPPLPRGFAPLGLVVLRERMRADAADVVAFLKREGVALKIMSGDAPGTVDAVARAAGFPDGGVVSGADLPTDDASLAAAAAGNAVFARVSPEQKQALVRSLVDRGRYVAMVGDGVNDVPAMKAARIAVALGSGSQIARGVSDIVLVWDDFGAIPRGVEEGRRILANLRRVAKLFVVKSAFAATLILTAGIAGAAYPLLPRQLSLAATLTVGIPSLALALAPSTGRPPTLEFIRDLLRFSVPGGVVSGLAVLATYGATRSLPHRGVPEARTVALIVLVLVGLYLVLLLEDEAMQSSRLRGTAVAALVCGLLLALVAVFAIDPLRTFFALSSPDGVELLLALLGAVFSIGLLGLLGFEAPLFLRRLLARRR
jgi:P-type E1-E2 ATPase